jgi:hypothetical protein
MHPQSALGRFSLTGLGVFVVMTLVLLDDGYNLGPALGWALVAVALVLAFGWRAERRRARRRQVLRMKNVARFVLANGLILAGALVFQDASQVVGVVLVVAGLATLAFVPGGGGGIAGGA